MSVETTTTARPATPKYSRVANRIWRDEKFKKLHDDQKLLFFYLLSSHHRTLEGIWVMPIPYISSDLQWSVKKVTRNFQVLEKVSMVEYDPDSTVVFLMNALRYQAPESANVVTGAIRRILDLPKTKLLKSFLEVARIHCLREEAPQFARTFIHELERALEPPSERSSERPSELLTSYSSIDLESKEIEKEAPAHSVTERAPIPDTIPPDNSRILGNPKRAETATNLNGRQPSNNGKDFEPEIFEKLWEYWPKKLNKLQARQAWNRIKPDEKVIEKMREVIPIWVNSGEWTKEQGKYCPQLAKWLTDERWQDDPTNIPLRKVYI